MAVHAGGHPRDGVRVRVPSGVTQRARLSAVVPYRLSQAPGRPEAADGLEGGSGLQPLLLPASRARCRSAGPAILETREQPRSALKLEIGALTVTWRLPAD